MKTIPYDPLEGLDTPARQAEYLEIAFETGDPSLIAAAIGDVSRAKGITDIAKETGLTRRGLYKSLTDGGNPTIQTVAAVLKTMGLRLSVQTADRA